MLALRPLACYDMNIVQRARTRDAPASVPRAHIPHTKGVLLAKRHWVVACGVRRVRLIGWMYRALSVFYFVFFSFNVYCGCA